jgi:hypothetical protein
MAEYGVGRLPVVSPDDPGKVIGIVTRSDLLWVRKPRHSLRGRDAIDLDVRKREPTSFADKQFVTLAVIGGMVLGLFILTWEQNSPIGLPRVRLIVLMGGCLIVSSGRAPEVSAGWYGPGGRETAGRYPALRRSVSDSATLTSDRTMSSSAGRHPRPGQLWERGTQRKPVPGLLEGTTGRLPPSEDQMRLSIRPDSRKDREGGMERAIHSAASPP